MNISFIGMSGAGKSYVGERYAQAHEYTFIDIDREMEILHGGKKLQNILDELGEEIFLHDQEQQVLALSGVQNTVISPGGSVVYTPKTMQFLKSATTVVYLAVSLDQLLERINPDARGIVGLHNKTYEQLYLERVAAYEKWADIQIDADKKSVVDIVHEIDAALQMP